MDGNVRKPSFAGKFYDEDPGKLTNYLNKLFLKASPAESVESVSALILPHAGFAFSGQVAASGVNQLNPESVYKTVFLIGASHRMGFDGASVFRGTGFLTPLGEIPIDTETTQELITSSPFFGYNLQSHIDEHSLEVELPLLQFHLKYPFQIVPILIGTRNLSTCQIIAQTLERYFNDDNLFIISTDFSHYPNDKDARIIDKETLDAILSNNPDKLLNTINKHECEKIPGLVTSLCGWSAVLTLLYITCKNDNIKFHPVMYQNSSDSPLGDTSQVVGYYSLFVTKKDNIAIKLSDNDKKWLLKLARKKIETELNIESINEPESIPSGLKIKAGAFVSVYLGGKLNGCIGQLNENEPLWKIVEQSAVSAAFNDDRFPSITKKDLESISIEISVLTPLKKIESLNELIPGKHGILIRKGAKQGTFLPQVAKRMKWTRREMLENCSRDKAGIGTDGWKDADLFIYEAIIFNDSEDLRNDP